MIGSLPDGRRHRAPALLIAALLFCIQNCNCLEAQERLLIPRTDPAADKSPDPDFSEDRPSGPRTEDDPSDIPSLSAPFSEPIDGSNPSAPESPSPDDGRDYVTRRPEFTEPPDVTLLIGTRLLNRLIEHERTTTGPVNTRIMGADVIGSQVTRTRVRLTAVPSRQTAEFIIFANGIVNSRTTSRTTQAVIDGLGQHQFELRKRVLFDGSRLLTQRAFGSVEAMQQPQFVRSSASGVPLLGPLGDQIAWSEVIRRGPRTNDEVVRQVADDVHPKFNQRMDDLLLRGNRRLNQLESLLQRAVPRTQIVCDAATSEQLLMLRLRDKSQPRTEWQTFDPELVGLTGTETAGDVVLLRVSESMVNQVLAGLPLEGLELTDNQLAALAKRAGSGSVPTVSELLNSVSGVQNEDSSEPALFSIRLSTVQPLSCSFRGNRVQLDFRFQIIPRLSTAGDEYTVSVELQGGPGKDDSEWSLSASDVSVRRSRSASEPPAADTWSPILESGLRATLLSAKSLTVPRSFAVPSLIGDSPEIVVPAADVRLGIHRIRTDSGILTVVLTGE